MCCRQPPQPSRRIILLGASNLTRGLSIVVETARRLFDNEPLHIFAAVGHGRAYGLSSRVLVRSLPSILDCGLWEAIEHQADEAPPCALVTDIGNDFIYGRPPEESIRHVGECLDRLRKLEARIIITQLPIASLRTVPRWRFELVRALLYPSHHLNFDEALAGAEEMNECLCDLAARRGIPAIGMDAAWYALDPIHIRRAHLAEAWARVLSPWRDDPPAVRAAGSLRRWLSVRRAMPERWWLLGSARRTPQPAARLPDGTVLCAY
ncbi:MAG: hypothetical protein SYC29_16380 [Planctomycetota bacterium]|nr:hypothetical protein [Planctomycetota bacterium]